ncbi:CoA transferase [Nocardiopsis sp. MG754419]|uniref:CoA transferase n=1 Tax=Nocardiopsis sp. MG754419 TaxID=2259865 RepID=UPI001BA7AB1F|nr:CoA transferase [Nocardiopsis sp. MG754419]MBR8742885.1 2-methylfumaryl-CoA isomerase [Nocardiopsis sp. MG754419]
MTEPHPLPLTGLRVVELSGFVATPLCGLTLAQLGAEVIRVEPLGGAPDRNRWPLSPEGTSLYWTGLNRGKRAIEVDLTRPEGRRLVADLIVDGDGIVVSNSERHPDLGFERLSVRRPDLIHLTLVGRRDGGTAVDYTVQAASGFPMASGPADHRGPVNSSVPTWDIAAGLYLASGLLAAERHRTRTGEGGRLRIALEDAAMATAGTLGHLAEAQLRPDTPREPDGNHVYGSFGRDFTSADGSRFMVVALTRRHWSDLVEATGLRAVVAALEHALDTDLSQEGERHRHREALSGLLVSWFDRHTAEEVRTALGTTRLVWSEYRTFAEVAVGLPEDPLFHRVAQPGVAAHYAPSCPLTVDGSAAAPWPAPRVGEHTHDVLGLDEDETRRLVDLGVLRPVHP